MTKRPAETPPVHGSDRPPPVEGAETSDAILRFMESIGHRSEAEFYLALFRAEKKESFANLVIEASVLRDAAEAVVLDLRFLSGLGLTPVVSLGLTSAGKAGAEQAEKLMRRLERAGVPCSVRPADELSLVHTITEHARNASFPSWRSPTAMPTTRRRGGTRSARFPTASRRASSFSFRGAAACGCANRRPSCPSSTSPPTTKGCWPSGS